MCFSGTNWAKATIFSLILGCAGTAFAVADVESRMSSGPWGSENSAAMGARMDMLKKMEYLQLEVQELRGKLEEQAYLLQKMQDNQKKLYADLDMRMKDSAPAKSTNTANFGITLDDPEDNYPQTGPVLDLDQNTHQAQPPKMKTVESMDLSAMQLSPENIVAEEKAYQQAYRLIQKKDYNGAEIAFKSFQERFPKGKYLPNVHYWLGEIYMAKNQFDLAAKSFENVYRDYPEHPKAADALLKMGYVEYARGHYKRAEAIFNKVKMQFAGSTSAQLAEGKISRMLHEGRI